MLQDSRMFSGFSVDDIAAAQDFYGSVLGLKINAANGMLELRTPGDRNTLVYAKPNHVPAQYTVLNFPVPDIDATIDALAAKGVAMVRYDRMRQDDKGVMRGRAVDAGPDIAWFTDPAGNVLSILQD